MKTFKHGSVVMVIFKYLTLVCMRSAITAHYTQEKKTRNKIKLTHHRLKKLSLK